MATKITPGLLYALCAEEDLRGGEEGAESEEELQEESTFSENRVSASSMSSGWSRWRRGVFHQPVDSRAFQQRTVQAAQAEQSTGNGWF